MKTPLSLVVCLLVLPAFGEEAVKSTITGNIFRPAVLEPTSERISTLQLSPGFKISVFAKELDAPE